MTTPAGWYPDPNAEGTQRYWDGAQWTEHTAPLVATTPADAPASPAEPAPLATDAAPDGGGGRRKLLGGVAAAVLVVAAGAFAVTQLASADGGADSPEAAVSGLFDSMADEDLVGMAEIVLPGERRTFVDPMLEGVDHLRRWGVLDESLDTSDVGGIDLEVEDLELRTEEAAEDVVNVFASGTMVASLQGEELPVGSLLEERALEGEDMSELDSEPAREGFEDVMITAVREDGRWYVSGTYTIAEAARADAGVQLPPPDEAVQPIGADSPEEAVDGLMASIADLDLEGMIARLHPDEASALQRYAPMFLDEGQAAIDEMVAEAGLDIEIEDLDYDIVERDGFAVVTAATFSLRATADGEEVSMSFDGDCTVITVDGETEEVCTADAPESSIDLTDTPIGDVQAMLDEMDEVGLVVAEGPGGWYVAPVRSYSEVVLAVMRVIDREHIERLIDSAEDGSLAQWFEEQFESMFGELGLDEDALFGSSTEMFEEIGGPIETTDLGDLVDACQGGDMGACDDLWWSSPIDSEEERIAETCGDTLPAEGGGTCEARAGSDQSDSSADEGSGSTDDAAALPDTYGDDPSLDVLWEECEAGDGAACDDLYMESPVGSEYEEFGRSCGGRQEDGSFDWCEDVLAGGS
ncbi:DUF2510 domain-containing protein [Actinomarinicola tropica]|uniref:DUF2510 domain-containing protein n=1 Tax=Actinomarinicola tropica TaxID=2789776 RepID=A0A5Q2RM95_9ACTN|nr:DUF2510 domain-containing protein [Actinomarinicola tropica]QGG94980.1 DUF2510 domain-containing protein [Actinomarinicola tropica]